MLSLDDVGTRITIPVDGPPGSIDEPTVLVVMGIKAPHGSCYIFDTILSSPWTSDYSWDTRARAIKAFMEQHSITP